MQVVRSNRWDAGHDTGDAGRALVNWRTIRTALLLSALFLGLESAAARAQDPGESSSASPLPTQPTPPPDPAPPKRAGGRRSHDGSTKDSSGKDTKDKTNKDSAATSASDQPKWDPLRAEKDLEVGQFYMKKGDLDAAIDRFQDAAEAKPGFAIPFKYLGEAQEKKGQKHEAIKSYTRYLDLYPHAEDAAKVRKKIEKLYSETGKKEKAGR